MCERTKTKTKTRTRTKTRMTRTKTKQRMSKMSLWGSLYYSLLDIGSVHYGQSDLGVVGPMTRRNQLSCFSTFCSKPLIAGSRPGSGAISFSLW